MWALLDRLWLLPPGKIMYIGGSDTLPPPLKREEEARLISLLEQGDSQARDRLIEHNLRLVAYIARRFENTGINIEDLISIGTIGLIKAVSTFDGNRNSRLGTYAARCIENAIHTQRHFWRITLQKCLFVCREKTGFFPENTIY